MSLHAFDVKTVYECKSKFRSEIELSDSDQEKSLFELYIKKDKMALKTSEGIIYKRKRSAQKGSLYVKKMHMQGRTLYYKLQLSSTRNTLMKSVLVKGFGNLIEDFVICKVKNDKK